MEISEILKAARKIKGLSQWEIADKLGIKQSTYSQYETGRRKPKMDTFKKILEALSLTDGELISIRDSLSDPLVHKKEPLDTLQDRLYLHTLVQKERTYTLSSIIWELKSEIAFNDSEGILTNLPEEKLLYYFWALNDSGQETAITRLMELSEINQYKNPYGRPYPFGDNLLDESDTSDQTPTGTPEDGVPAAEPNNDNSINPDKP